MKKIANQDQSPKDDGMEVLQLKKTNFELALQNIQLQFNLLQRQYADVQKSLSDITAEIMEKEKSVKTEIPDKQDGGKENG